MEEKLKKFELNNMVLEDFDSLMSKHLDQIEELTISEIEAKSKLLNIIGLCINIKTLIIDGDERTNVNNIISNICKPELLQNLILNGVKIPSKYSFKKLVSLRMVSLNNIRSCSAKVALDQIVNPEKIEALNFELVDFAKSSIECIKRFENLKYLNLIKVQNCNLDNLNFLSEMKYLERINIEKNVIKYSEIYNIIKCKFNKQIQVDLPTAKTDVITNNLEINEKGKVSITINSNQLEELTKNLNLFKVTDIIIIISNNNNLREYINILKRVKGNISIAIKDCSCLSVKDAKLLKEHLKIKFINIIDFDEMLKYEKNEYCYKIEDYIRLRTELDKLLEPVLNEPDELLKVLNIYKILGESIVYDELLEEELIGYSKENLLNNSNLEKGLLEKKSIDVGFAEILKNALSCVGIESKIVRGSFVGVNREYVWNQVKILDKWYNVDLASDSKRINNSKNKKIIPLYCLIGDKKFRKTHIPIGTKIEYCPESIDKRLISVFFKKRVLLKQYVENILHRITNIFKYNKERFLTEGKGKHEK
ncbi:MAG: hypothetical protein IKM97_00165 [Clostridia bacterium]|nr:hypothetical protein [Clostridia bacterium]